MADDMPYPEAFNAHLECAQAAEDERFETMNENITWGESHLRGWTGPAMEEAERSITALAGTFAGPRIRRGSLYLFTPNVPEAAP